MGKLHSVMDTLNERSMDRDLMLTDEQIASLKRMLKEVLGEKPPSTLPLIIRQVRLGSPRSVRVAYPSVLRPPHSLTGRTLYRVRRGSPYLPRRLAREGRAVFRLADLVVRRRRCVQVRFRLRRVVGPRPAARPPWRPPGPWRWRRPPPPSL